MAWGSILAPIAGAVAGNLLSGGDASRAQDMYGNALAQYAGIEIPDIQDLILNLTQYQSQGELDPYLEQLVSTGPSAFEDISLDPRFQGSQLSALGQYEQLAQTGLSDADKAAMELARQNAASEGRAANAAVMQNMQQRGMGGSGLEMLSRLTANQNATQNLQKAQLEQAQMAQQARMQALQNQANLSTQMQNQAAQQAAQKASAQDAIAQFNAQNSQGTQARNVASRNQAQQSNLQNRQNIANQNVGLLNQQQQFNKNLKQQEFENKMRLAAGKSGAYTQAGNQAQQQAGQTAGMWAGIGQGVGTLLGSFNKPEGKKTVQAPNSVGGNSPLIPFDPNDFD